MSIEDHIQSLGNQLFDSARDFSEEAGWIDKLVTLTTRDEKFRVQALRFIDVLPSLEDDVSLTRHLQSYFGQLNLPLPELARWGLDHSDKPWLAHVTAPLTRFTIRGLSRKFMGGQTRAEAATTIKKLRDRGMNSSLDILGEATINEREAEAYQRAYLELIADMAGESDQWQHNTKLDQCYGREIPRLNISLKPSSLYSQINPIDYKGSQQAILNRLYPIIECAREHNAFVMIDMEQYDYKHITLGVFNHLLNDKSLSDWPNIGIAIQAYLKDAYQDLQSLTRALEQRDAPASVRLVRGAYWDYETVIAEQNNWRSPVWSVKQNTDANFERCLDYLLSRSDLFNTAVASHNIRSLAATTALAEHYDVETDGYEFQMLYGMADPLKKALIQQQKHLRIYVPFGKTLPGMSYLVRRLLENSSGESVLDIGLQAQLERIDLQQPVFLEENHNNRPAHRFQNTPLLRFTDTSEHEQFLQALERVQSQLGKHHPMIINGEYLESRETITSLNPAQPEQIIGTVSAADQSLADRALAAAQQASSKWKSMAVTERAGWLRNIAARLADQRFEFAAWQVLEAGKNWTEADADVCEAIDFLNYYADQAERLGKTVINDTAGEHNVLAYRARGIGLVIPPWNFPLAILTGMLSATIVSGNTAILKPSSQTPVIAARFIQLAHEAGLPPGVINLVPGSGEVIGDYLARSPDIHLIAFTGSEAVGTRLIQTAAHLQPQQRHLKRIIAEMGGKNAIIIDDDADLDVAVTGTIASAFGFQGQKCSACSRVIVLDKAYDLFIERLLATAISLKIGPPQQAGNLFGPVISHQAFERIHQAITTGKECATLLLDNTFDRNANGYFISPVIFTDVVADMPLAQEEIFGPVLSVMRANDFSTAIAMANSTRYALTGGVYSRNPQHLRQAADSFNVGNLYLNRKITGALVARQPFGGFNMSGTGYKAGGENYLQQFMESYCVTENTLRRGFAPALSSDSDY
jgi:RHH-type proline utilization regulon transcriptional repressor/proline dehydrogenase/delta 1-pyrroline-5-carboxylate dehydrogenase